MLAIDRDPLTVRLPPGMRARLRQRAAVNRRSMNSEIVHYLDRALAADESESPAAVGAAPGSNTSTHPQAKE